MYNGKMIVVSTKLEPSLRRGLRARARKQRLSVSKYIAALIEQDIRRAKRLERKATRAIVATAMEAQGADQEAAG